MVDFLDPQADGPSVVGDRNENIRRAEALDPTEVEEVTDEEQAQYEDFVSRALAMISDTRTPEDGSPSPSEAVINVMNNSSMSVPEALAEGAVSTIGMIHDAAKRAGSPYSPDVLFHGSDEIIAGLYLLGSKAGIFEGVGSHEWAESGGPVTIGAPGETDVDPMQGDLLAGDDVLAGAGEMQPPEGMGATLQEGDAPDGDFTDDEYVMLGEAKILAVEKFGKRLMDSGQMGEEEQREAQEFWKSQIEKEVELGNVDDSVFQSMDLDAVRQQMAGGMQQ